MDRAAGALPTDDDAVKDPAGISVRSSVSPTTEDTLAYLVERIRTLIGRDDAVVAIHGGTRREERRKVRELFTQDKDVAVL